MTFRSSKSNMMVDDEPLYTDVTNIQYADLLALVTSGTLKPKQKYLIINSFHGGTILLEAISSNQLNINATWNRFTNLCAFGIIGITSGAAGSVDTLTVNGVNIMTASVPYVTSLAITAANVATNINANSVNSGYKAFAITNGYIVIQSTTSGTAKNGYVISGTATTLTLGNTKPLACGANPVLQQLNIIYDISTDRINQCSDFLQNILICEKGYTGDPFQEFPWGDSRFYDNRINSVNFKNNFLYDPNSKFMGNQCLTNSSFNNNFFSQGNGATYGVFYNTLFTDSQITGNVFNYTTTNVIGQIYRNTLMNSSSISSNCITGSTNTFVSIVNNSLIGASSLIALNISALTGTGTFIIQNNILLGSSSSIRGNTGSNGMRFLRNVLTGPNSSIRDNIYGTSVTSTTGITDNMLAGLTSVIRGNTLNAAGAVILNNYLNGANSCIQNSNLTGTTSTITGVYLNGNTAVLDNINFNSIANATVRDIILDDSNITLGGITLSADFPALSKIQWGADEYNCSYTSPALTGAANLGQSGSPITIGYVPAKYYSYLSDLDCGALAGGAGATLQIGIDTDNNASLLPATVITTLASSLTTLAPTKTKATALRKLTATPGTANITGGNFKIIIKGRLGI